MQTEYFSSHPVSIPNGEELIFSPIPSVYLLKINLIFKDQLQEAFLTFDLCLPFHLLIPRSPRPGSMCVCVCLYIYIFRAQEALGDHRAMQSSLWALTVSPGKRVGWGGSRNGPWKFPQNMGVEQSLTQQAGRKIFTSSSSYGVQSQTLPSGVSSTLVPLKV